MKSELAEEIADHATEIAIWCLRTLKRHRVKLSPDADHPSALEFHLTRLESLLEETDYPLIDSLKEQATPNEMLQVKIPVHQTKKRRYLR